METCEPAKLCLCMNLKGTTIKELFFVSFKNLQCFKVDLRWNINSQGVVSGIRFPGLEICSLINKLMVWKVNLPLRASDFLFGIKQGKEGCRHLDHKSISAK